jgi:Mg/Co/Ni transporter MgtE
MAPMDAMDDAAFWGLAADQRLSYIRRLIPLYELHAATHRRLARRAATKSIMVGLATGCVCLYLLLTAPPWHWQWIVGLVVAPIIAAATGRSAWLLYGLRNDENASPVPSKKGCPS